MPPQRGPGSDRPVIGFLTDFGLDGAAAICKGVMLSIARDAQIVDISHTVAKYAIADGAYLLATAVPWLPVGVHVAVVDPGVGTSRRPIALRTARGDVLVGPDNGLLIAAADRLGGVAEARLIENRTWQLPVTSTTFHGRDVFAPVAAHLAGGAPFREVGRALDETDLVTLVMPRPLIQPGFLETVVAYVDSYGNLRLAGGVADLAAALGPLEPGALLVLEAGGAPVDETTDEADGTDEAGGATAEPVAELVRWSRTFGEAAAGDLIAYEDSSGALAVAVTLGNAARRLGVGTGARIGIRRA